METQDTLLNGITAVSISPAPAVPSCPGSMGSSIPTAFPSRTHQWVLGSMFCADEQISIATSVVGTALQYIYGLHDSTSSCNGRHIFAQDQSEPIAVL